MIHPLGAARTGIWKRKCKDIDQAAGQMQGAISQDINEEIRFLTYRLEVLSEWPDSPDKDARIAATHSRLKSLLAPQPAATAPPFVAAA
jgi:hypothetical protein